MMISLPLVRFMFPVIPVVFFLLTSAYCASASFANFSIPFTTWGPQPINATAVQWVNATVYNHTLSPVNYSLPTIRIAGVISLTGAYTINTALVQQVYPFMLDMINMKGGIIVKNQSYLLSLTWASDDSSPNYLQLLYAQWLNDPTISLLLSPTTDEQYKTVLPLMLATNRTFFNLLDGDPANFACHYPYVFTAINTKDRLATNTVNSVNARAQQFGQQVQAKQVLPPAGSIISAYGITTMCMYTHNDSTPIETCQGIREWVNSTNQLRMNQGATHQSDMLTIVQDVFWGLSSTSTNQDLYTTTFNLCPDNVDLLVICGEATTDDSAAVAAALQTTQLRPKAAYTSSTLPGFDPANATMLAQWSGWLTHASPSVSHATIPYYTFPNKTVFTKAWQTYFDSNAALSSFQTSYPAAFDMIKAALSLTESLASDDLRAAFLSLNGTSYVRGVNFNPLTGANDGSVTAAAQLQGTAGLQLVSTTYPLVYPAPWPWSRVQVGDTLSWSQGVTMIVVSLVMAVLGCWVAQIVVEQAVFVRRRGGLYQVWLLLVAIAMGVAGMWCSQLTMASTVTVSLPGNGAALPLQWSLWVAMLAWLPSVLLTWAGLMLLMQDVEDAAVQSTKKGVAHAARPARKEAMEAKRKKAALSHLAHLHHLKDSFSWKVALGGILISVAMWVSRYVLWSVWDVQATFEHSASAWVISAALCVLLVVPALLIYFHALKLRVTAVFLLSVAVIADWQVHISVGRFAYAASVLDTPAPLYTILLSSTAVTLITGIICALTCFGFIGLQFSRMQLSRNGLSVLVASLEAVINKQREKMQSLEAELGRQRAQGDSMVRLLECINILRPIPKEYAFALATQANTSTLSALYDPELAQAAATTITASRHLEPRSASVAQMASSVLAIAKQVVESADVTEVVQPSPSLSPLPSCESPSPSPLPTYSSSEAWDGEREASSHLRLTRHASHHHTTPASPTSADSLVSSSRNEMSGGQQESHKQVELSISSLTHVSTGAEVTDHTARLKQFELNVLAALADQAEHGQTPLPSTIGEKNPVRRSTDEGVEFSLFVSSLGGSTLKGSDRSSGKWPAPSLLQLLQHPVCVEVLKDELERIHSVENLMFFLHAVRYRKLLCTGKARRAIATYLFDTFIAVGSEEQINISTRQRDAIAAAVKKNKDDACTATLFQEAEHEVGRLMETNVMKTFSGSTNHRLCVWLYHAVSMKALVGNGQTEEDGLRTSMYELAPSQTSQELSSRKGSVAPIKSPVESKNGR